MSIITPQEYSKAFNPFVQTSISSTAKRTIAYAKQNPLEIPNEFLNAATKTAALAVAGGVIGFGIGATAGGAITRSFDGAFHLGVEGGKLGCAAGATIGTFIFGQEAIYTSMSHYNKWKLCGMQKAFVDLHDNSPELANFICPIAVDIFAFPVRTKFGNVFEITAITDWIAKEGRDPYRREEPLSLEDLRPAFDVKQQMLRTYIAILERDDPLLSDPAIRSGMEALKNDCASQLGKLYDNAVVYANQRLEKGQMTRAEHAAYIAEAAAQFLV